MGRDTHEHIDEVVLRLSKVEGHIRAVKKMLEEGEPCDQVLLQLSAVKSAMNKLTQILLQDHYDHCLLGMNKDKSLNQELIEFRKILNSFIR